MKKKILWVLFAVLAVLIGLYPLKYLLSGGKVGILNGKPDWLLNSEVWNISFYTHIVFGGVALLIGWLQFNTKLRLKKAHIHKIVGNIRRVSFTKCCFRFLHCTICRSRIMGVAWLQLPGNNLVLYHFDGLCNSKK